MVNLSVQLSGITLKNPVITASGTFGYGLEFTQYIDLNRLGALVVKGLSLHPSNGNPPPRIIETPAGMLNAIGLQNIGVDAFINEKLPDLRQYDVPVIANIYGNNIEDYVNVASRLSEVNGIAGLEVNCSCPNVKSGGMLFGKNPALATCLTKRVREVTSLPLIVKLTPNVSDISEVAQKVEEAGADIISLVNTFLGMAIDVHSATPRLANITGGLSGPAIKPIALRMVWEVAQVVSIPVIGIGGIVTAEDALEFMIAGASAVQVGTANLIDPEASLNIVSGIAQHLEKKGLKNIHQLVGSLKIPNEKTSNEID